MIEGTPSYQLFFINLLAKKRFFTPGEDGSFYATDENFLNYVNISPRTLVRARKFYIEKGYIKTIPGKYKGHATKYWITPKGVKMACFNNSKGVNLSSKGVNLSSKGCQNGTTIIDNKIRLINKGNQVQKIIEKYNEKEVHSIQTKEEYSFLKEKMGDKDFFKDLEDGWLIWEGGKNEC